MTYANTHFANSTFLQSLARPFVAIGNFMDLFAEAVNTAHAANRVVEMSDADLAAKGMTRAEAIQKVFS